MFTVETICGTVIEKYYVCFVSFTSLFQSIPERLCLFDISDVYNENVNEISNLLGKYSRISRSVYTKPLMFIFLFIHHLLVTINEMLTNLMCKICEQCREIDVNISVLRTATVFQLIVFGFISIRKYLIYSWYVMCNIKNCKNANKNLKFLNFIVFPMIIKDVFNN